MYQDLLRNPEDLLALHKKLMRGGESDLHRHKPTSYPVVIVYYLERDRGEWDTEYVYPAAFEEDKTTQVCRACGRGIPGSQVTL